MIENKYRDLLAMLRADKSLKGRQNYAIIRFGLTVEHEAAELIALMWGNVSRIAERYRAAFIGKGEKRRAIQLETEVVKAARRAFRTRWKRAPKADDLVFQGLRTGRGNAAGLTKAGVHVCIKNVAEDAKVRGVVRPNLQVSVNGKLNYPYYGKQFYPYQGKQKYP